MSPIISPKQNTIDQFVAGELEKGTVPNELINEKSPYLLQHAFNPVHWYPWGEAAFVRAKNENKPIFLSIGYSTCHWCHVMEKESFENPEIAAILNKYFVSIKIDREERPDLDQIYMTVTQAMTGGGGWPMSVFLTPDLQPFYAGTYFPPQSKYGRPGFAELLDSIQKAWQKDRENIVTKAGLLVKQLSEMESRRDNAHYNFDQLSAEAARQFTAGFDEEFGGFGRAPKFPRPVVFNFLFNYGQTEKNQKLVDISLHTLKKMGQGGIYDHLAGGFHRYSVDRYWRVPHFEKMLYDQALLVMSYLDAYQITKESFYARIASETLDFVLREMTSSDGAFYSALDADSYVPENPQQKKEGAFYLWSESEVDSLLHPDEARLFKYHFGLLPEGNTLDDPHGDFGIKNVLYVAHSLADTAKKFTISVEDAGKIITKAKSKLFVQRGNRPHPHLDDKILTSWNGLMISALAKGATVLGEEKYLAAAKRAAVFIRDTMMPTKAGLIFHRYRDGAVGIDGQLDDYAFVGQGFIELYEVSFEIKWLVLAKELLDEQVKNFADDNGGFYESLSGDPSIILRMKSDYEGAEPAGNSISALNFLRVGQMLGDSRFTELGEKTVNYFSGAMKATPIGMPQMLTALKFMEGKPMQIIVAGKQGAEDTVQLQRTIANHYLPNTIVLSADLNGGQTGVLGDQLGFLASMTMIDDKATAYVCKDLACLPPVNEPEKLDTILRSSL